MKNLNDLTIKEYNDYSIILDEGKADGNVDIFSIMEIYSAVFINILIVSLSHNSYHYFLYIRCS